MTLKLVVGNRLYSSWSLRAGILLRGFGIAHEEEVIAMYKPDTRERMLAFGPTGKVPILIDGDITVWDSLAIVEYVAETHPDLAIWPKDRAARAHARSASAEMHSGFTGIRSTCPMNLTKRFARKDRGEACAQDVVRIEALWREARHRFGGDGPYLYGAFSAADAMYAPVVTRLDTYSIEVADDTRAYMDTILNSPGFLSWKADAEREPWALPHYEEGETAIEVLYVPDEARAG